MSSPDNESRFGGNSNPQRSSSPAKSSSGGGNVFTRKLGPLPLWAWMGIALAIALVYYIFVSKKQSAATANTPDNTTAAGQIPQFVNEVNSTSPPAPPDVTNVTVPITNVPPPIRTGGPPPPGPKPIHGVPDLVGMTRATGEATLKNAGLEFQYDLRKGQKLTPKTSYTIVSQNPPSGAQVQPGQKIQLTVEPTSTYLKKHKENVQ